MSVDAAWLDDPTGAHELRYWDGAAWTAHVSDAGATTTDPIPPGVVAALPEGAEAAGPAGGRGGWKDRLKGAAQQAAQQGKQLADQAKDKLGEQQAKRMDQWRDDPATVWVGQSQTAAGKATGMAKASYRITAEGVWIDSGLLGTRSDQVPLWSVRDVDVRQGVLQRGKDIGDVVLHLDDPMAGTGSGVARGEVLLDNIEGPHHVRDLLLPLIADARTRFAAERRGGLGGAYAPGGYAPGGYATPPTPAGHAMAPPPPLASSSPAPAPPPSPAPAPAAAAPPAVDVADQLRKLAELRAEGILTDEEFAAQKAKLLGA